MLCVFSTVEELYCITYFQWIYVFQTFADFETDVTGFIDKKEKELAILSAIFLGLVSSMGYLLFLFRQLNWRKGLIFSNTLTMKASMHAYTKAKICVVL